MHAAVQRTATVATLWLAYASLRSLHNAAQFRMPLHGQPAARAAPKTRFLRPPRRGLQKPPSGNAGRGFVYTLCRRRTRRYGATVVVGNNVRVPVLVRVGVRVGVAVRVLEGVRVSDAVLVFDGVFVYVLVGDEVRVFVYVRVREGVGVLDAVRVGVTVLDMVAVVVSKDETAVAATADGSERFVAGRESPIQHDPQLLNRPWPS